MPGNELGHPQEQSHTIRALIFYWVEMDNKQINRQDNDRE